MLKSSGNIDLAHACGDKAGEFFTTQACASMEDDWKASLCGVFRRAAGGVRARPLYRPWAVPSCRGNHVDAGFVGNLHEFFIRVGVDDHVTANPILHSDNVFDF